jgi:imidazole glycerol phosphate synthase glutamine amidotransferase subunit
MMRALDALDLRAALTETISSGVPYLGICLGMQALFSSSEEAPEVRGLGLQRGDVKRFRDDQRIPHMGWNRVETLRDSRLLRDAGERPYVYFAHSYHAPVVAGTVATCSYGVPFTAVLEQDNVIGVQFHPEKSGRLGLAIVRAFVEL